MRGTTQVFFERTPWGICRLLNLQPFAIATLVVILISWNSNEAHAREQQQDSANRSTSVLQQSAQKDHLNEFFESKIRPLLVQHCLECHGADEESIRGGLRLTSRNAMLKGGDSGPAIVPGSPNTSLLISSIHYEDFEMPPAGQLKESEIKSLTRWIELGAPDPRIEGAGPLKKSIDIEKGKSFWAFQPRQNQVPPSTDDTVWPQTPIDQFILATLEKNNIAPVADANRETLIRRATIDLIGLPPTIAEIDAFLDDPDETLNAFETVVDRLLASRHFGERWGRHWLDVVRFAESSGGGRSLMFPDAWRFRDFVIQSFNDDKPFDLFLKQQIAGDLLPAGDHELQMEQIVATGMLVIGPVNYDQQDKELLQMEVVDEQMDTVGRAFMGLTLGCARCHDHKFDPIPTRDYYAMAGIFGATQSLVTGNVSTHVRRPLATRQELDTEADYQADVDRITKALTAAKKTAAKKNLEQLSGDSSSQSTADKNYSSSKLDGVVLDDSNARIEGDWLESSYSGSYVDGHYLHDDNMGKGNKRVVFSASLVESGRYEVRLSYSTGPSRASNVPVTVAHRNGDTRIFVNELKQPPIDGIFVSLGKFQFDSDTTATVTIETTETDGHVIVDAIQFLPVERTAETESPKTVSKSKNESLAQEILKLERQLEQIKKLQPPVIPYAMSVNEASNPVDGHVHIRGSIRNLGPEVPRGLLSVCCDESPTLVLGDRESGRLQLAEWMASPEHPLTARVYVNRIWRHLFGAGLVTTTDNLGSMGTRPSHPELLDFLANQFVSNQWSTKKLIRAIMLSRVYQLSAASRPDAALVDPSNRLLWRSNRRRVDAEVLRDSMLMIAGELDLTPGGLTIRKVEEYDRAYAFDSVKRSVYVPAFRNSRLDLFEVFDGANPSMVVGNRATSTIPTQALFLLNSPMVMKVSENAAVRLESRSDLAEEQKIEFVYRQTLGRGLTDEELRHVMEFVRSFDSDKFSRVWVWTRFYHAIFSSLEFQYID